MAAPRSFQYTLTALLCSVSLAACSGGSDNAALPAGASAPPTPTGIVVVNHGLGDSPQDETTVLAPTELKPDETLIVENPPLQEGVPQPLETVAAAAPAPAVAPALDSARLAELEKEVAALRADYNSMLPAFNGLITTNERIKSLLDQIEEKAGFTTTIPAAAPPVAIETSQNDESPKSVVSASEAVASGVRLGEHGDRTRLVIDISQPVEYKAGVTDRVLTVALPGTTWSAKAAAQGLSVPLVSGWTAMQTQQGTVLSVDLKAAAGIIKTETLKGEGGAPTRIVIDIGPGKPAS